MKVRVTETAFAELEDIYLGISSDNQAAARAVCVRIEQVISRIGEFPGIARAIDESGIRIFPTPPFPYLIFYTATQREVIIRNVRYAGRIRP